MHEISKGYESKRQGSALFGVLGLLGGLAILLVCDGGATCKYDSDCTGEKICQNGRCRSFQPDAQGQQRSCRRDTDCPGLELCTDGWCTPSGISVERPLEPYPPSERLPQEPATRPEDGGTLPDHLPDTPQEVVGDPGPPPELGPTPILHVLSSGGAVAATTQYVHFGLVGQACPLIPASTVMRSPNYSVRVGFIAVAAW